MKKILIPIILGIMATGCASIGKVEGMTNEAYVEKIMMPDSSYIYKIYWQGKLFIYNRSQTPNLMVIE